MLNITNHREKQMKTTMNYDITPVRMTIIKREAVTIVGKDVGKRERLFTVGGNVNWCSHYGKKYGGSTQKN